MIDKAPDAYRTISEVAEDLDLPQHVLRFWETRFSQIKPLKRGGGRRYYRPDDVELLKGIRQLLYAEGYTIKGVQRILKEQGPKAVQSVVRGETEPDIPLAPPPPLPQRIDPVLGQSAPPRAPVAPPPPPAAYPAPPSQPVPTRAAPVVAPPQPAWTEVAIPVPALAPLQAPPPATPSVPDLFSPEEIAGLTAPAEQAMPAHAPPVPAPVASPAPVVRPTVSFMRGGLVRAPVPPGAALPVEEEAPAAAPMAEAGTPSINVRRTIRPTPPGEEAPARYSPLVEPDLAEAMAPSRATLTEESRRALQSALFELTECRRVIERVMATRAR